MTLTHRIWRGDAVAVAQVVTITPGDLVDGREYTLRINGKDITVTADGVTAAALIDLFADAIDGSSIPEWREVTAVNLNGALVLTSSLAGVPFKVSGLVGGFTQGAAVVVTVRHSPTGGTWNFDADVYGDADIAYNAVAADAQTAMDGLFGAGNTLVTRTVDGTDVIFTIEFIGALAGQSLPAVITVTYANLTGGDAALVVTVEQEAVAGVDNVQTLTYHGSPTGGNRHFTLPGYGVAATAAYNANNAAVKSACQTAWGIGDNFDVSGTANVQQVFTFRDAMGGKALPSIQVGSQDLTGGTVFADATVVTEGSPATNQMYYLGHRANDDVQAWITIARLNYSSWSGGNWTLTINGLGGIVIIPYDATNLEIAALVEAALDVTGVSVDSIGSWYNIYFNGEDYSFPLTSVSFSSSITGGSVNNLSFNSGEDNSSPSPSDMEYKLTLMGSPVPGGSVETAPIPRTATEAEIKAAIEEAAGDDTVNVTLIESLYNNAGLVALEFIGALGGAEIFVLAEDTTFDSTGSIYAISRQTGVPSGAHEVVDIEVHGSPTTGSFLASIYGQTTEAIRHNDAAGTVQSKFRALPAVGTNGVTGTNGPLNTDPVTLTFGGPHAFQDVPEIVINDDGLKTTVVQTTPGVTAQNEIQRLSISGQGVWGGTVTPTIAGGAVSAINHDASLGEALAILETSSGLDPDDLQASTGGPWPENDFLIDFGGSVAGTNVALTTATDTLKNGTATGESFDPLIVALTTRATGPNHFNDRFNWVNPDSQTARAPERANAVWFTQGDVDCKYGYVVRVAFTVDTANDWIIPATDHDLLEGQIVEVWTNNALPAGLAANTSYYVRDLDNVTGKFRLSATATGSRVNITTGGTGTHQVGMRFAFVRQLSTYEGDFGLPWMNEAGYKEYRPVDPEFGLEPTSLNADCLQLVTVGQGDGRGSTLFNMSVGTDACTFEVINSGSPQQDGVYAVNIRSNNSANALKVWGGDVGVAARPTETSAIGPIELRDGTLSLGQITYTTLDQTGGILQRVLGATPSGPQNIRL